MDSKTELIEKDSNTKRKKCYNTKKFWIIISIISFYIIAGIIVLIIILLRKKKIPIDFNYEIISSEFGSQNILVNWSTNQTVNITINVKGVENEIIRKYNIYNSKLGEQLVKVYFGIPKIYAINHEIRTSP